MSSKSIVNQQKSPSWFRIFMDLGKIKITFSVTVTTTVGYILAPGPHSGHLIWPVLGILLIGLSSAALNQVQDRNLDKKMERTRNRPLPSGIVSLRTAVAYVVILFSAGIIILALKTNTLATILGFSAFFWYNGIYTYLKRISPLAVIPGSVIGGVPPAVGWTAAGGDPLDPFILAVCVFMVIWQIPHFWLLLFLYGDDYSSAGLPTLTDKMSIAGLEKITFAGILVTVVSGLSIVFYSPMNKAVAYSVIGFLSLAITLISMKLITGERNRKIYKYVFIALNIYSVLVLISTVIVDLSF